MHAMAPGPALDHTSACYQLNYYVHRSFAVTRIHRRLSRVRIDASEHSTPLQRLIGKRRWRSCRTTASSIDPCLILLLEYAQRPRASACAPDGNATYKHTIEARASRYCCVGKRILYVYWIGSVTLLLYIVSCTVLNEESIGSRSGKIVPSGFKYKVINPSYIMDFHCVLYRFRRSRRLKYIYGCLI